MAASKRVKDRFLSLITNSKSIFLKTNELSCPTSYNILSFIIHEFHVVKVSCITDVNGWNTTYHRVTVKTSSVVVKL